MQESLAKLHEKRGSAPYIPDLVLSSDPGDVVTEEYRRVWRGYMSSWLVSLLRPMEHVTDEERLVLDDILRKVEWLSAGTIQHTLVRRTRTDVPLDRTSRPPASEVL
jgi:hypothetical protein